MLHEERVLVRKLIDRTKKNELRWRFTVGAVGGLEFSSDAGSFVLERLSDGKPTLSMRSDGRTFLIRDYLVGALMGVARKQIGMPPKSKTLSGKTKLDKVLIKIKREALQRAIKLL